MIFRQRTVYGGSVWVHQWSSIPNFPAGKVMSTYSNDAQSMVSYRKMGLDLEEDMPRKSYCWSNRS